MIQLTDREDLAEWSIHLSADGRSVFFSEGTGGWRVNLGTLRETQLAELGSIGCTSRDGGRVRSPYPRCDRLQRITREMWILGTRELSFVD